MEDLILNLQIISKIPRMGRVYRTKTGGIGLETSRFSLWVTAKRFLSYDSRQKSVNDIQKITTDAMNMTRQLLESKYMTANLSELDDPYIKSQFEKRLSQTETILDLLSACIIGLENLCFTYRDDIQTVSQIEVMSERIRKHVNECQEELARNIKL